MVILCPLLGFMHELPLPDDDLATPVLQAVLIQAGYQSREGIIHTPAGWLIAMARFYTSALRAGSAPVRARIAYELSRAERCSPAGAHVDLRTICDWLYEDAEGRELLLVVLGHDPVRCTANPLACSACLAIDGAARGYRPWADALRGTSARETHVRELARLLAGVRLARR